MPQSSPSYTFGSNEKLKSRKLIQQLFSEGKSFLVFPVKVVYLMVDEPIDFPVKVGVSASSRNFKKAVQRNRIKRLLREHYRHTKQTLVTMALENKLQVAVFLLYIDKAMPTNEQLKKKMPIIIERLIKNISENNTSNT